MYFLADLRDDATLGGKARSLVRMAAVGFRTPRGFVVTDALFRALRLHGLAVPRSLDADALDALDAVRAALLANPFPPGFEAALAARLSAIGADRFVARSSFAEEDDASGLAAGVFESRIDVGAADLPQAIKEVLGSALGAGALAYALGRGRDPEAAPRAVLVHAFVPGEATGSVAHDPAGTSTPTVSCGNAGPSGVAGPWPEALADKLREIVTALARRHGAIEIEWVATGTLVTLLQLRPWRPPAPRRVWAGFSNLRPPEDPARWTWDASHNPLPLSPAQAALVELVDAHGGSGLQQRVFGHYLFYARQGEPADAKIAVAPSRVRAAFAELTVEFEQRRLAQARLPSLAASLDFYLWATARILGEIQPAVRGGRQLLDHFLRANLPQALPLVPTLLSGVASIASERTRLATAPARSAFLLRFGDEAPIWDVACPTWAESLGAWPSMRPGGSGVAAGAARTEAPWRQASRTILAQLPRMARLAWKNLLPAAREAVAVGEDDDWLYARAQAVVRRALLDLGQRLAASGSLSSAEDVFFLPWELVTAAADGKPLPFDASVIAARARADTAAAAILPPPLTDAAGPPGSILRGHGTGGRAVGRVVVHVPGMTQVAADAVLVATTILPTELPLLHPLAFVSETGGPLDHVAAQARERGLPAVVGVVGAQAALWPGRLAVVDADRGLVLQG